MDLDITRTRDDFTYTILEVIKRGSLTGTFMYQADTDTYAYIVKHDVAGSQAIAYYRNHGPATRAEMLQALRAR